MNIAVLEGRFDPPHISHLLLAEQMLEIYNYFDQFWFLPISQHAFKPVAAGIDDRLAMLKFLCGNRIKISDTALTGGVSYTLDTVRKLSADKKNRYYWVTGSDAVSDFSSWRQAQKLSRLIKILVFPRGGYPLRLLPPGFARVPGEDLIVTNLSSTVIRRRIKESRSIRGVVPDEVGKYIIAHNLYR